MNSFRQANFRKRERPYIKHLHKKDEYVKQPWRNSASLEEDPSGRRRIDTYIDPRILEPLKNSFQQAKLRKKLYEYKMGIGSECTKIYSQLSQLSQTIELWSQFDVIALATIYYNLGVIYKDCRSMKDTKESLYNLSKSRALLRGIELNCTAIVIAVKTVIAMGEIQETETKQWLTEAIKLCLQYIARDNFQTKPIYTYLADVSEKRDLRWVIILLYGYMIRRMGMLYCPTGEMDEWIKTVHEFLNHRAGIINSPNETCEWSNAAVTISTYLIKKQRFTEARNCLTAAEYMLRRIEGDPSVNVTVMKLNAEVADAWLTYTTNIMRESASQLQRLQVQQQASSVPNQEEPQELLLFTSLSEHLADINNRITDSYVSNMHDADRISCFAIDKYWLARNIFVRFGNDVGHLQTAFKYALTFKYLTSFTTDTKVQIKIHESRKKLLRTICNEYAQNMIHVLEVVFHLGAMLEMWKDAAEAIHSVIAETRLDCDLYSTSEEKLQYILNLLDYYKHWLANRRCYFI
ncbi:uncharacterized protein LOC105285677 isoform X2 [Ooceraea biroi]|uniref:uncharacterized protein LOC105285677 isoform X2 n=1 Tax=Ooceraea biroi TaxID=2015173 RepID=UPI0005BC863E|nr:uncharacterized protein LOC105285677 isoform X2 [Ooceraea biroi]